ncbi:hypothetical protein C8J56DRAFT_521550 [Mycena floridula]|nr:hypothetical protein C8J56DRAFT_521550 [Mycena floridula]
MANDAPIPRFPLEIMDLIFQNLEPAGLVPVLLSTKSNHKIGARLLYRSINVSLPVPTIMLLRTLSKSTQLALVVKSLTIDWLNDEQPPIFAIKATKNVYQVMKKALRNLTALESLTIDIPSPHIWVLGQCIFSLERFSTSFPCDASLAAFLDTQPRIENLTLRGASDSPDRSGFLSTGPIMSFPLKKTSLPSLHTFRAVHAGADIIKMIVQDRPVSQVSIPLHAMTTCASLDALALSSASLQRLNLLSFEQEANPGDLVKEMAKRFPDLQALHVLILLAPCSAGMLRDIAPDLSAFHSLKYITFMGSTADSTDSTTVEADEESVALKWKDCCPSLSTIILPTGTVWFLGQRAEREDIEEEKEDERTSSASEPAKVQEEPSEAREEDADGDFGA